MSMDYLVLDANLFVHEYHIRQQKLRGDQPISLRSEYMGIQVKSYLLICVDPSRGCGAKLRKDQT